jgi:hypothetical protein
MRGFGNFISESAVWEYGSHKKMWRGTLGDLLYQMNIGDLLEVIMQVIVPRTQELSSSCDLSKRKVRYMCRYVDTYLEGIGCIS